MSNLLNEEIVEPVDAPIDAPIDAPVDAPVDSSSLAFPDNWKELVGADLKDDPSLAPINNAQDLIKSYVNAQRMIGADKAILPSKHDDGTQLRELLHKVGLPNELEKYEVNGSEENKEFLESFKQKAHELGVLPQQAQGIFDHISQAVESEREQEMQELEQELTKEIDELKQEWGQGFQEKISLATKAVDNLAGEDQELKEYLKSDAIGGDPKLVRVFAKIGEMLKEDNVISDGTGKWGKTPDEANQEISNIMGNPNHPYNNAEHPNHMNAVQEVAKLTQMTI